MDNQFFVKLCSRGWSLAVLASLARGTAARVSPVAADLKASRTTITSTFAHLIELGLLVRNSGHGHPLRPEFCLTELGERLALWADDMRDTKQLSSPILRKTWSLPVIRLLETTQRYGTLRSQLLPVTDRALSLTLNSLAADLWIERSVDNAARPPQVSYVSIGMGKNLQPWLERSYELAITI